jgi:hypothetical protein
MLKTVALEATGCAALAAALALAACTALTGSSATSNATITTYVPLTSVEVDSASLFGRLGCGTQAGVPYKYVVSVYVAFSDGQIQGAGDGGTLPAPLTVGVSDCFSDAVFQNLSAPTNTYAMTVDVFDQPTYEALRPTLDLDDGNVLNALAAAPTADDAKTIHDHATWSTTCFARQEPNVQSLAACGPLP